MPQNGPKPHRTGLWKSKGKDNGKDVFLQGKVQTPVALHAGDKVFVFKNTSKRTEKSPDYSLVIQRAQEPQEEAPF